MSNIVMLNSAELGAFAERSIALKNEIEDSRTRLASLMRKLEDNVGSIKTGQRLTPDSTYWKGNDCQWPNTEVIEGRRHIQ